MHEQKQLTLDEFIEKEQMSSQNISQAMSFFY